MSKEDNKQAIPGCFDCANEATARLNEMFIEIAQAKKIALGQRPAERAVFRKLHGAAWGKLVVREDLPAALKVGIFAKKQLPAWVRFSSDTTPTSPDLDSTLGIGVKIWGVDGKNALGEVGDTADFILQNYPVFFVDDAKAMCEFTYAGVVQKDYPAYLAKHPTTRRILDAMGAKIEGSVLTTQYWAILPFAFGPDHVARYTLVPKPPKDALPEIAIATDVANYLALDLQHRLSATKAPYEFDFMVQVVPRSADYPLDKATEEWPTDKYPYVHMATLSLPHQDVCARGQPEYGQELAFNIWRTPVAHTPLGSIAAVRKVVYDNGAKLRHQANGQPLEQPLQPRMAAPAPARDECIVSAAIYPSIGVARVGNAPEGYVVGPEVTDPPPKTANPETGANPYRDAHGRLYPQAARFRIYGCNAKGEIVRELTAEGAGADIEWTVHLANKKSAWYEFQIALDIPLASTADPSSLRNSTVSDRASLVLDAGPHSLHVAPGAKPKELVAGKFMGQGNPVYLGKMWCEAQGRLLVTGGRGLSASFDGSKAITFANNEGWHDDTSDGPVTAKVRYQGTELPVTPAWIVVAPPDYGPNLKSVRTMWDLMRDVAIQAGTLPKPLRPSFTRDIYPIFERMTRLQWVNAGFAAGFGWDSAYDFGKSSWIARLNDRSLANGETRRVLKNSFRHPNVDSWSPMPWPWLYGDAMDIPATQSPLQYTSLSKTQLDMLDQWAAGDFDDDWGTLPVYVDIDQVPVAEQGDMLTKAALEFCLADAFHPGCEMTWPVRTASMYMAPFRFKHAPAGWIEPSLGAILTSGSVTIPNGPLYGQLPGGITRWMAVPWQTDTASCRSGYDKTYDPYVPTFWPARVPNEVLTKQNYDIVMDAKKSDAERLAAFANRAAWIEPLGSTSYTDEINNMIAHFDHLGVVEARPGPGDARGKVLFPPTIQVEDRHRKIRDQSLHSTNKAHRSGTSVEGKTYVGVDLAGIDKVRRLHPR